MKFSNLACLSSIFIISIITFYSCQKEPKEKIDKVISSKDPQSVSSSIKVWHGIRTQGNPPAEKGSVLQLDNTLAGPLYAIAGRYAIIQPEVIAGDVAGYYLEINGASDYFKVDYTKPRNTGRQKPKKTNSFLRMDSLGGNLDSAIVIVLPANLHVPDTICMTYWAYDNSGNVSNPVDVCVIISSLGTDANGNWLNGTWKYTAQWDNSSAHDTIVYNKWTDYAWGGYYCNNGLLQWSDVVVPGQSFLVTDSSFYRKADLTYGINGGLKYEIDDSWKDIDYMNATCSNIVFRPVENEAEILTGAWSYNSATRKLIIVFEFDDAGIPVEEAYEFDVIKVNDKNVILVDNTDPSDPYYSRFEKF
jgi:hypothetical protein